MRLPSLVLALLATLLASTPARAQFRPALMIETVTITDSAAYAVLMDRANTRMRDQYKVPVFLRAYLAQAINGKARDGFCLSPSATLAGLMANRQAFAADPELVEIRAQLAALTTSGPSSYLKAVRFDGTNTPGWLCNSFVQTDDEAFLLERVAALAALLLPAEGEEAAKFNVFRVIAGHDSSTHLISINATSAAQLATLLDRLVAQKNPLKDSKITTLSSSIYEELMHSPK